MKRFAILSALLGLPLILLGCAEEFAGPDAPSEVTGRQGAEASGTVANQFIVVLHDDADPGTAANDIAAQHGGEVLHVYRYALNGFALRVPAEAVEGIRNDPRVAYVEADIEIRAFEQVLPEGIDRIDADLNATANIDGVDDAMDVDIAILDTGIDLDHPDLDVVIGPNCIDDTASPEDGSGHGTHVAGTAAAIDNDSHVVGVAPGARVWAVKVLDDSGNGTESSLICGVDYVTANADQIEVANMSLGGEGKSDAGRTALQNSVGAGVVYVVAAGNGKQDIYGKDGTFNTEDDIIPAAYPEAATISAMADFDGVAGGDGGRNLLIGCGWAYDDAIADCFSNYSQTVVSDNPVTSPGAAIDLAAPGVRVLSTMNDGGTANGTGTSMASPHVAGAAALYIAANGRASDANGVAAIRQALIDAGQPQSQWGPSDTRDPDSNPERLVFVANLAPPEPVTDIAITGISAPASVVQGESVTVDVTIENVGNQDVTSDINVTLTDDTDGVTIGTQTISGGLAAGASTTLSYSWDTGSATLGDHTLTAGHDFADDDAANDSSSTVVTVESPITDIAVAAVNAPSSVVQGDVVTVDVTIENVGNQDVTSDINVTLTDDTDGVTIGTQTISGGLATGASTTLSYSWDTGNATLVDHTLTAGHDFADDDATNDSNSTTVSVSETSDITLSATGYKVRGLQKADLEWSGATSTNVDVYRDGALIATTENDGFYTDNIDQRGGGSYTYQVCEEGSTSACSNEATVNF